MFAADRFSKQVMQSITCESCIQCPDNVSPSPGLANSHGGYFVGGAAEALQEGQHMAQQTMASAQHSTVLMHTIAACHCKNVYMGRTL